jgi:hypothetical protein
MFKNTSTSSGPRRLLRARTFLPILVTVIGFFGGFDEDEMFTDKLFLRGVGLLYKNYSKLVKSLETEWAIKI